MSIVNYFNFDVIVQPDPNNPNQTITKHTPGPQSLFSGGLVMDMVIGVDSVTMQSLQTSKSQTQKPIAVKGLFDTGCTITSIDNSIVNALNLAPRGYSQTCTANGAATVTNHLVSIAFPGTKLTGRIIHQVQSVNLSGQPFQVLIGRDLMAFWNITYNGTVGFVSISD